MTRLRRQLSWANRRTPVMSQKMRWPLSTWTSVLCVAAVVLGCGSHEPEPDWSQFEVSIDLARELQTAELLVETRRIAFGTSAAGENLLEGWSTEMITAQDGTSLHESSGEKSILQFVVLKPRDLAITARIGPADEQCAGQQNIVLELNGKTVQTLTLERDVRDYRFVLQESDLVPGNNTLVITSGDLDSGSSSCRRSLWGSLSIDDGEPLQLPSKRDGRLFLPFGTAVRYLVETPSNGYLTIGGIGADSRSGRLGIRLRRLGESKDLLSMDIPSGKGFQEIRLPIRPSSWLSMTLSAAITDGASADKDGLLLSDLQLRFRKASAGKTVMRTPPQWRSSNPQRPNVIIYLVDTLRADHLGSYGYHKPVSPSIDEFAADAVLFEETMAQTSWTRCAVASVFTGMVPTSHGVIDRKDGLAAEAETLAEVLRGAGYDTASFVATGHVSPRWGMAQGFETFKLVRKNDMGLRYALSNGLNPPIFDWLDRDRTSPFFLYVHTLDPHSPYAPRAEAAERFAPAVRQPKLTAEIEARLAKMAERLAEVTGKPAPVELGSQVWIQGLKAGVISSTPTMLDDLIALYDAEIFHNDTYFGEFLDHLRSTGLYDNTVIVFVSDHGEEFLDHGSWTHGHTLYQEQLRVPLIIRFPDPSAPRGLRVNPLARQIDIAATIADYIGLRAPADSQGSSLLPAVFNVGVPKRKRTGYAYLKLDASFGEGFFDGKWKLVCLDEGWRNCQLYDLTSDPLEQTDLAHRRYSVVAEMKRKMRLYLENAKRYQAFQAEPDKETRAQLEALGYVF